ncbi:hypothetical protein B5C34_14145 [Pacificimonas flava]|uniref:diguanylate cyclase n=2 Tax=Pacificimonas TaxID=1960290 RepID=A0A219B8I4_9SPHN|nr:MULTISPECIES: diguanylate cyclase [Pacificimonas]MBZ6379964.1 diguanylate cyclase [Pacificimonas aurantium]OWV34484.1 hypothetical protein B5C34_14145 [Pacificimonas flava]
MTCPNAIRPAFLCALLVAVLMAMGSGGHALARDLAITGCSVDLCGEEVGTPMSSGEITYAVAETRFADPEAVHYFVPRSFRFDRMEIEFRYADGSAVRRAYDQSVASANWIAAARFAIPLPEGAAPPAEIRMQLGRSFEGHLAESATIESIRSVRAQGSRMLFLFGLLAGVVLVPLFANLALLHALREPFQRSYALMSLCVFIYGVFWSNSLFAILPGLSFETRFVGTWVSLGGAIFFNLLFLTQFLERRVLAAWQRLALPVTGAIILTGSVVCGFYALHLPEGAFEVYHLLYLPALVVLVCACVTAYRNGSQLLWIYLISWLPALIVILLRILRAFGLLPQTDLLDLSIFAALAFEVLIISVALGYRALILRRERDEALERQKELSRVADIDPLTGLFNRRGLIRQLAEWPRGAPIALILFDLDHFKTVNDRFGHLAGDAVLSRLGDVLRRRSRDTLLVRAGGEEFGIVLRPEDSDERPVDHAMRILDEIRATRFAIPDGGLVSLTASFGVAEGRADPESFWTGIYRRADEALFLAKAHGRDRVEVALAPGETPEAL